MSIIALLSVSSEKQQHLTLDKMCIYLFMLWKRQHSIAEPGTPAFYLRTGRETFLKHLINIAVLYWLLILSPQLQIMCVIPLFKLFIEILDL